MEDAGRCGPLGDALCADRRLDLEEVGLVVVDGRVAGGDGVVVGGELEVDAGGAETSLVWWGDGCGAVSLRNLSSRLRHF